MIEPLKSLLELRNSRSVVISMRDDGIAHLASTNLIIDQRSWKILVDDEYEDLNPDNQLMCFFLVIRELETYLSEPDFLKWTAQNGSDASNEKLLEYYRELGKTVYEIKEELGEIDSKISGLDYELRTGVIDRLIATK